MFMFMQQNFEKKFYFIFMFHFSFFECNIYSFKQDLLSSVKLALLSEQFSFNVEKAQLVALYYSIVYFFDGCKCRTTP